MQVCMHIHVGGSLHIITADIKDLIIDPLLSLHSTAICIVQWFTQFRGLHSSVVCIVLWSASFSGLHRSMVCED